MKLSEKGSNQIAEGGLLFDLPTKNPKKYKKSVFKEGDTVLCSDVDGWKRDFIGNVHKLNNVSAVIYITISEPEDDWKLKEHNYKCVVSFKNMRKV